MLAFETRIKLRNKNNRSGSSTNATSHGCGRGGPRRLGYGGNQGGRGSNSLAQCGGCGRFNPRQAGCGGNNGGPSKQPMCQVCHKVGHTVDRCWYKYDEGYTPDPDMQLRPPTPTPWIRTGTLIRERPTTSQGN
jgi:hypothetical protein